MKRLSLFSTLCLLIVFINACQQVVEQPAHKPAKGAWEWEYSAGGFGGYSLAPAGSTFITLDLDKDSTYTFYLNNAPQFSGSYSIQAGDSNPVLHFDRSVSINQLSIEPEQQILVWDSSNLQLQDYRVNDGYVHYFKRVN